MRWQKVSSDLVQCPYSGRIKQARIASARRGRNTAACSAHGTLPSSFTRRVLPEVYPGEPHGVDPAPSFDNGALTTAGSTHHRRHRMRFEPGTRFQRRKIGLKCRRDQGLFIFQHFDYLAELYPRLPKNGLGIVRVHDSFVIDQAIFERQVQQSLNLRLGDDRGEQGWIGTACGPEHTGFFEAGADHGVSGGFDNTGANE